MKEIKESQQSSQGITIGNPGNQGGAMPKGAKVQIINKIRKTTNTYPTRSAHRPARAAQ